MKAKLIAAMIKTAALPALLVMLSGCPAEDGGGGESRLRVFVSVPPQAGLVERIAGDRASVGVLVEPGQNPHTYEPTPRQVLELGKASLYFKTGMPFEERLLEKIGGALDLRIVDTAAGITRHTEVRGHANEADFDEAGGEADPHIWLSPPLLKKQAGNIAAALADADPGGAELFRSNLALLLREIDSLHERIAAQLSRFAGRTFYVHHAAFGYFGEAYGLRQEAIETEGKSPTPRRLAELIGKAKSAGVRVVFVQPQFDGKSAETLAEAIGGAVVPLDPMARDVLAGLREIAGKLERAFSAGS